jgi:RimJ/RimL family protein N-acetyltransferase
MAPLSELPRLVSQPIVLRRWTIGDLSLVQSASIDPVIPRITSVPTTDDPDEARAFVERQDVRPTSGEGYSSAIADAASDEALGQIGLWPRELEHGRASVGYWIIACQRRRGIASVALRAISEWGLGLPGIDRLELYVEPWNEGSYRTAERVGYKREVLLRRWESCGGGRRDMYMYSLLREDRS